MDCELFVTSARRAGHALVTGDALNHYHSDGGNGTLRGIFFRRRGSFIL